MLLKRTVGVLIGRPTSIITAGVIALSLGCVRTDRESVSDYFWPLDRPHIFIYELPGEGRRIVEVTKITKETDKGIIVETDQHIEGVRLPHPIPPVRETFEVAPKEDVIYRVTVSAKKSPQRIVYFKGPIEKGVQWPFRWTTAGQWLTGESGEMVRKEEAEEGRGLCRIEGIEARSALGRETRCALVTCPIVQRELVVTYRQFHCKGLGYIGTEVTGKSEGHEMKPEWLEKLVEIR